MESSGLQPRPQASSSEQEDPLSKTSKSNSAAVVLGPGLGSSAYEVPGCGSLVAVSCSVSCGADDVEATGDDEQGNDIAILLGRSHQTCATDWMALGKCVKSAKQIRRETRPFGSWKDLEEELIEC